MPNYIVITMSSLHDRLRHSQTLLLVAFIHQLHACPCGCLDENGWFQAGRALFVYVTDAADSHDLPGDPTVCTQVEDDQCDASGSQVFLAGRRSGCSSHEPLVLVLASQISPQILHTSIGSMSRLASRSTSTKSSAADVRANLQVFLI